MTDKACATCKNFTPLIANIGECELNGENVAAYYSCNKWAKKGSHSKKHSEPLENFIIRRGRAGMKIDIATIVKKYFGGKGYHAGQAREVAMALEALVEKGKLEKI